MFLYHILNYLNRVCVTFKELNLVKHDASKSLEHLKALKVYMLKVYFIEVRKE